MCQNYFVTLLDYTLYFINERNDSLEPRLAHITIVDARMGRGKSSAAIRYMNEHKDDKRFLYITPFLDEVDRICQRCDFDQPDSDHLSKSTELKNHLRKGHNVSATHSLFYLMDNEAMQLVRDMRYSLIVDESIQVVERVMVTDKDLDLIISHLADLDEHGILRWRDPDYTGKFAGYKEIADTGSLLKLDTTLLNVLSPDMLNAFDEVFMLTYMIDGQYQKAYLDYFGFTYKVVGVECDQDGFRFSDKPDDPPPVDFGKLINLTGKQMPRSIEEDYYSLSKSWYAKRKYDSKDIRMLRNGLRNFFVTIPNGSAGTRIWTCYKDDIDKLVDAKTKRYRSNFLQIGARATNEYRDRRDVAYMANRFIDPNIMKFFSTRDVVIDKDKFALSEMLQWIWRSAIRDGKPINLYIPSRRMRGLLIGWIRENGGTVSEQTA